MRKLKLTVDISMTFLLLLSMCYETVGSLFEKLFGIDGYEYGAVIHEYIGTAFILLVIFHLWLNRRWLMNIFKGSYNPARFVLVSADIILIVDIAFILISGVMMSRVLGFDAEEMSFARTSHILASYWGYVIMSFHIGLHIRKFPTLLAVPALYGCYAFIKRQIHEYMFLRTQFVFFDFEEPLTYFILDYIAVMILFAGLGFYVMKFCRR